MYQLGKPAAALAAYIEHYWFVCARPGEPFELTVDVYVDARADLILNFGDPYSRTVIGRAPEVQRASNLDAQRLRPIRIAQQGAVDVTGVRFHTGGLAPFVTAAVRAWSDRVVPIDEVFGPAILALEQALRVAADARDKAALLDAFFLQRLQRSPALRLFLALKAKIEAEAGLLRMDHLCDLGGVSIRQLDRLFRRYLGVSPKTFARVVRFQQALTLLKSPTERTLAEVAAACGYYDQPHFVREFKAYAGVVPRAQIGYFPSDAPADFSPNLVQFVQDAGEE